MADYTDATKVAGLISQFAIDGSSSPTTTELDAIMEDVAGELNTCMAAQGLAVPVTTPDYFLDWLEGLASAGAAARALKSMFPGATGPAETPAYSFWHRIYDNGLKMIKSGDAIPPDAVSTGVIAPSTYGTKHPVTNADVGENAEPMFKVEQKL